jgi:hypothetical protein
VREVLWPREEVGEGKRREETARELHERAARNSYKAAAHHEEDGVPVKCTLAPRTICEQNSILEEYLK